jgi:hypothetical protein
MMPVDESRFSPSGRVPVFMVYVGVNPAETVGAVVASAEFTVKVLLAKETMGAVTVREKEEDPVPDPLVARMVIGKIPVSVGIPEIFPVTESSSKPVGKVDVE